MWELDSRIQHYDWGSTTAIPEFLGRPADGAPWAEAWYGAHPLAPSTLATGQDAAPGSTPRSPRTRAACSATAWSARSAPDCPTC